MPNFKIVSEIPQLPDGWSRVPEFKSKNRIVGESGKETHPDRCPYGYYVGKYEGKTYRIIEKHEKKYSKVERVARFILGSIASIATLGVGLLSFRVRRSIWKLFTKEKATVRYAFLRNLESFRESKKINKGENPLDPSILDKLGLDLERTRTADTKWFNRKGEPAPKSKVTFRECAECVINVINDLYKKSKSGEVVLKRSAYDDYEDFFPRLRLMEPHHMGARVGENADWMFELLIALKEKDHIFDWQHPEPGNVYIVSF